MAWLFTLGIITLALYHEGFRKLLLWAVGVSAALFICLMGWLAVH